MKQYIVDELRPADYKRLRAYLGKAFAPAALDGIFRVPLDPALFSAVQKAHRDCQPYWFALELERQRLCCELLVRTDNRVKCDCMGYATERQRNWIMAVVDNIFTRLEIKT